MKTFSKLLIFIFCVFTFSYSGYAQPCTGLGGSQVGEAIVFCNNTNAVNIIDMPAGDYVLVYVCSANTYTFTTCNSLYVGDTEISVLDEFGNIISGVATDYVNDNTCNISGNDETLVWTPPAAYSGGGYVQVVVTQNDIIFGACQATGSLSDLEVSADGTCAPDGACCEFPDVVTSSSYSLGPISTCGYGDFYDDGTFNSCSAENFYINGNDYVIEFTPPTTGPYEFSMPSNDNTFGFFVLDGCPDSAPTCLYNDGAFTGSPLTGNVDLVGGTTYYVVIGTNPAAVPDGIQCGNFEFEINPSPPGAVCSNPFVIADGPFPVNINGQTTCGFGNEYQTSNCAQDDYLGGEDMVFTFTPSAAGCYLVNLTAEAWSSITVLDDCPDAGGMCIGFDGTSAANPEVSLTLSAGTTYYIVIDIWPTPDCFPFDLTLDMCPPGDVCENPFIIPSAPYTQMGGTTCGFGDDYNTSTCGNDSYIGGEDYVMQFTPATTGCYSLDFTNTDTYLGVFVWDACPPGASGCIDFAGNTGNATNLDTYLEAGITYYFVVSTWPAPDCSAFDFSLTECAQDGEDCSSPAILTTGSSVSTSTCPMGDNYDQNDGCMSSFMNGDDIVFEFTPGSDGCYDIVISNPSNASANFGLFVLDGCPDATTNCIAQGTATAGVPTVTANLLSGTTYTFVVATSACSDFDIIVNSVACPAGESCANPQIINTGSNGSFDMAGSGDDYGTGDACGGPYMGGNDFVMTFTPAVSDCYNFTTSAGVGFNPDADLGLFILDGCPDVIGTNCITFAEIMDGFPMADAYMNAGQTYFIVLGAVEFTTPITTINSQTIFDIEVTAGGTNCPSGINCGNPIVISGPGVYSDLTNCGFGSDYDDTDGCTNAYMFGEETVFTFTPSVTDCYDVITSATPTSSADDDVGLFVLDDCPDIPSVNCLLEETQENGFPSGSVTMEAGVTYYIIVSAVDDAGAVVFSDCADFNLEIAGGSMACPIDCTNAIPVTDGMNAGLTSCGAGDDYSDTDIAACNNPLDFYINSEETVMTFVPGSTGCYIFETSNGSSSSADPAIFVFDDCPDTGPNCIATGVDEDDMPSTTAQLIAGQTYYIVFSAIEIIGTPGGSVYSPTCSDFDLEIYNCPPSAPVQDCEGAIPVCQNTYSYNDGFLGSGNNPNEIPASSCLFNGELNSVWFIITVQADGDLSFLITPLDITDDYDFAVYDITTNGCTGIASGASPELSCNYSISAGVTGAAGGPGPLNSQGASGVLLNNSVPVTAGQTLVLIVSNFSTSLDGFDLDFSASTADIVDDSTPDFDSVTDPVACDATTFDVVFDEPITCASIANCDFTVTYPDGSVHNITNINGAGCGTGNFESDFTFTVDGPMDQNGTYTIDLGSGCGGVEDNCGNTQDNTSISFDVTGCATCSIDLITPTDANCGMSDGSALVEVSGVAPFTVTINGQVGTGASPVTVTGLPAGTYTVTLEDDAGCMSTGMVTIGDIPGPTIDMVVPTEASCGQTDGEAEVTISGGAPDYTVTINGQSSTGMSPVTVTGLAPGTYPVDVVDDNGCSTSGTVTITEQASPTIDSAIPMNSTCGNADGSVEVTISGGTPNYTVDINGQMATGGSPVTVTGLPAGSYSVLVTDMNGCTAMGSVSVSDAAGPTIDMVVPTEASCGQTDGEAEVTISGGAPDYTVTINGQSSTGTSPVTVTGLAPGTYPVDVVDDNGCSTSGTVTITEQASPTIDSAIPMNSTCGNADGSVEVTISGGTPNYTVDINGQMATGGSPVTVTGLPAGSYSVLVTDMNGCTAMGSVSVSDAAGPTIDMVVPTEASCNQTDGEAEVTISGGAPDYTVTINGQSSTGTSPVTVTGLAPGTYPVDVVDDNGCSTSGTVTITEQASPTIDSAIPMNSTCGNADGSVEVTISGGTPNYTVDINGQMATGGSPVTVTGLPAGSYSVLVTDMNGCTAMGSVSVSDAAGPTIDMVVPTEASCNQTDGEAEVTISGGAPDYTVTINGQSSTGTSPVTVTGLAPGTYPVDVVDDNGCSTSGTVTITEQASPTIDSAIPMNSTCGNADGSVEVTISGGTPNYTVDINGQMATGGSPVTVTGLPAGSYSVLVTDMNGCTAMGSVSVSDAAGPTIDMVVPTEASCGQTDGEAEVTISGGAPDYTVTINGQSSTGTSPVTVTGLAPGTYPVDVVDDNGCSTSGTVTITEQESPTITMITPSNSNCGASDGSALISISGGSPDYTVTIDTESGTGPSPVTVNNLSAGTYTVIVTDINGCTDEGSVTISDNPAQTIDNLSITDASCGMANGEVVISVSGGQSPYDYNLNGNSQLNNPTFTGLLQGTYPLIVTDNNGCTATTDVVIGGSPAITITSIVPTDETCGQADGTATINISGGTAPITYNLITDQIDNNLFTDLEAGTYSVLVTDANGCTDMSSVTIGEVAGPMVDLVTVVDASCGQMDGEATITVSGGLANYNVELNGTTQSTGGMTTFTGLGSGSYIATVTDANGCTTTANVNIADSNGPTIDNISITDADCGMATGEIVVTASGGTGTLVIKLDGTPNGTNTFSNLIPGTYNIEVEDDNGCIATTTATVGDTPGPVIDGVSTTPTSCSIDDGTATVTISGGTPNYTVEIGTQSVSGSGPDVIVNNLGEGTYTILVTDANGCTNSTSVTIDEVNSPMITSIDVVNENCDLSNGSLTINISGGLAPITYDIGNGTPQTDNNTFIGLTNGTYTVIVTDANGCTATQNATINNLPGVVIDMVNVSDANCGMDNGEVTVVVSGGLSPFTYDLDGTIQVSNPTFTDLAAGSYTLIVTDANNCTDMTTVMVSGSPGITIDAIIPTNETCGQADGTATINISGGTAPITYNLGVDQIDNNFFTGLTAGTYNVLVTDANGCTDMSSVTIDETAGPMIDNIIEVNATCGQADGEATIIASGGVGPYDYTLDGVTQSDPNNTFTGLNSGNYLVVVTDQNGCTATSTANITDSNGPVIDAVQTTDADCDMATGSVTVLASGGTPPLIIRLNGMSNGTNVFNNLIPGSYDIEVEDANGCISTTSASINNIPGVQIDNITTTDATCGNADGTKTVTFSGGSGSYNVTCGSNTQTTSGNSITFTGLSTGTYGVTVTDANGCTDEATSTINETDPPVINNIEVVDENCGNADGSITINASGGLPPYTYNNGGADQSSNVFNDLSAGTYNPVVTDANGCSATLSITVNNIPGVIIDDINTTPATCGNSDGTKTIIVSGGLPPYTYDCNGVQQVGNNFFDNLAAGSYLVIVTDANGCSAMETATISDSNGPIIDDIQITDASCGLNNGEIIIIVSGGTSPYNYSVNGGSSQTSNSFTGLASGTITVQVTDANGCNVSQNVTIGDSPQVTISSLDINDANCDMSDGSVTINVGTGTSPFTYNLNGTIQVSNATFVGLAEGSYPLTITDANGCTVDDVVIIGNIPGVTIDDLTVVDASCDLANGSITVIASGGDMPFSYQINGSSAQSSNLFGQLIAGSYTILVTDANGCSSEMVTTVNGSSAPMIDNIITTNSTCGTADGTATIIVSGGTSPYTYTANGVTQSDPNNVFSGLASGTYPLLVEDALGCTVNGTINITDANGPVIDGIIVVDAMCGTATGSVTVNTSGGMAPITIFLNGTMNGSNTFPNLLPGTYNVSVQDDNGCIATATAVVGNIPGVTIDNITSTVSNCGQNNGTVTINVSSGVAPITYDLGGVIQIDNNVFTGVAPGVYSVNVTDSNNCMDSGTVTVDEEDGPELDNFEVVDANCGNADGSVTINVSGGLMPYIYTLGANSQTSNFFDGLFAGNYDFTVEDANGCSIDVAITVGDIPGVLITNINTTDANCGSSDGALTVIASGGTTPYTYDIGSGAQSSNLFNNLASGIYNVTVVDANGCIDISSATINDANGPVVDNISTTPATCGGSDGTVTIEISGGVAPYDVTVDGMTMSTPNNTTFIGLSSGSYTATIVDANGCITSTVFEITEEGGVQIDNINVSEANCGSSDGSLTIEASGGTMPYTYDIGNGTQMSNLFLSLPAGEYMVTVTDANGCTATQNATINNINGPVIDDIQTSGTNCGLDDGSVFIQISGGESPYDVELNGVTQSTMNSVTFTDLPAGNYPVLITDVNGCETNSSITIMGSTSPTIDDVTVVGASTGNDDGEVTVTASGGIPPYDFELDGVVLSGNPSVTFTMVGAGTYILLVTDANGCTATQEVIVPEGDCPTIDDIMTTSADCGVDNGSITITASGGTPPLMFVLDGGTPQSSNVFTNVSAGLHTVSVLDDAGCDITGMVDVGQNGGPSITAIDVTASSCGEDNGSATIMGSGGLPPYLYSLNGVTFQASEMFLDLGSGNYTATLQDANGCIETQMFNIQNIDAPIVDAVNTTNSACGQSNGSILFDVSGGNGQLMYSIDGGITFQSGNVFTDLSAGTYDYVISDDNCEVIGTASINNDGAPIVTAMSTNASCGNADGQINVTVDGGIPPYTYTIGANTQSTPDFPNLPSGTYIVEVADANNCIGTASVMIEEVGQINIAILGNELICGDGFVELTADPLTEGYNFVWSIGGQTSNSIIVNANQAGNITLTATKGGCTGTASVQVVASPNPIADAGNDGQIDCLNPTTTLDGSNSMGNNLSYSWTTIGGNIVGSSDVPVITVNAAGQYILFVTDNVTGCESITDIVEVMQVGNPMANAGSPTTLNCNEESIMLDGTQSTQGANFSYQWTGDSGQTIDNSTSQTPTVYATGTYTLVVTDDDTGCSAISTVVVNEDLSLPSDYLLVINDETCFGDQDGALQITQFIGGVGPFMFSLDGGTPSTSSQFTNLAPGSYDLTIISGTGCILNESITILSGAQLSVDLGSDLTIKLGETAAILPNLSIDTSLVSDYEWFVDGDASTLCENCFAQSISPEETTIYSLEIYDENGCFASDDIVVNILKVIDIKLPNIFSPNGDNINDFFFPTSDPDVIASIPSMRIFDRWGNLIFENTDFLPNDPLQGWDGRSNGKAVNPGVFVFTIEAELVNGQNRVFTGDVTIAR